MFDGVHTHASHLGPAIPFHLIFVVGTTGLQQRFVDTTATGNDTHTGTVERGDDFLNTGWKLNTGHVGVLVMSDHGCVTSRCTSQLSAVTRFLFDIADDC